MNYFYITGTSKGIGKAIAEELLKDESNTVVGIARTQTVHSKNYRHVVMDLSDAEKVAQFEFNSHPDAHKIALVNNAATLGEVNYLGNLDNEEIWKAINVNLTAAAILMNSFIRKYKPAEAERLIINLTSGAAQSAYDGWAMYCSGKAALDMLTRVAAVEQELTHSGIIVLAIAPGVVDTDMQKTIRAVDVSGFSRKQKFIDLHRNRQLYSPEAVAKEFVRLIHHPGKARDIVMRMEL